MPYYGTTYNLGNEQFPNGSYSGEIKATSPAEAMNFAEQRGLGEVGLFVITGRPGPRTSFRIRGLIKDKKYIAAAHEASFLCFVGISAGVITVKEALGDDGLVHELIHLGTVYKDDPKFTQPVLDRVMELVDKLENGIPGHWRSQEDDYPERDGDH